MRYIKKITSICNSSIFAVNWQLTNRCNNKCSYCPDGLNSGVECSPTISCCLDFVKIVAEYAKSQNKQPWFELSGGEPTTWKHFGELVAGIKEVGGKILVLTNGKRSLDWWKKIAGSLDVVDISFHVEFANEQHLRDLIVLLDEAGAEVHCNVMMFPERFQDCLKFAKSLSGLPTSIDLQPLIAQMDNLSLNTPLLDYSEEQMYCITHQSEFIGEKQSSTSRDDMVVHWNDRSEVKTSTKKIIDNQSNYWPGWNCYIGVEQIIVDHAGFIKRGWCQDETIGHIGKPGFEVPKNWIECNRAKCHCAFDMRATKENFEWPF